MLHVRSANRWISIQHLQLHVSNCKVSLLEEYAHTQAHRVSHIKIIQSKNGLIRYISGLSITGKLFLPKCHCIAEPFFKRQIISLKPVVWGRVSVFHLPLATMLNAPISLLPSPPPRAFEIERLWKWLCHLESWEPIIGRRVLRLDTRRTRGGGRGVWKEKKMKKI